MVKQNNSVNKSTSKKTCPRMRAINHPDVIAEMREEKRAKAKATAEKKIKKSSTRVKKRGFCMMRAENDYTLLNELARKKELENRAKGNTTMVCSECKTRNTPLWRKGPKGPKTLCNACGLRLARLQKAAADKEDCGKNKSPAGSSSEEVKKP